MKTPNWNDLLPTHEAIRSMTPARLEAVSGATSRYIATLAFGIAGVGNLLACTASSDDSGLDNDAVTHVGWLLESLGDLIGKLADTEVGARFQRGEIEEEAVERKPKAALARRQGESTLDTTNARIES